MTTTLLSKAWSGVPQSGKGALGVAAMTWLGVGLGRFSSGWYFAVFLGIGLVIGRRWFWVVVLAVATSAGLASQTREIATGSAPTPAGTHRFEVQMVAGPYRYGNTKRFVVAPRSVDGTKWRGPPLALVSDEVLQIGQTIEAIGEVDQTPTAVRARPLAGTLSGRVSILSESSNPFVLIGNRVRSRVVETTSGDDSAHGLLAGFLVGETAGVAAADIEAMRRAGLSHFVAVSGSNVALFLMGWWIITMPLSLHSRPRAWLGLLALGVFVVATRWEPSVVRASGMAGLVLLGRLLSWPVERWFALGATVTSVLLVSPELSASVGFQLSVAATAGVMAAPQVSRRPRWLWTALYVTLGAQLAVAPLLFRFGPVPALAPIANLAAAPLVSLSTALAMAGVLVDGEMLIEVAAGIAQMILRVAWLVYGGPQLQPLGLIAGLVGFAAIRIRGTRALGLAVAVAGLAIAVVPTSAPQIPIVEFLDVGQGDAALVRGTRGEVVLIDGGPDPTQVLGFLAERSITHIDLIVASHIHADHVTGLLAVMERLEVDRLWHSGYPQTGEPNSGGSNSERPDYEGAFIEVLGLATANKVEIEVPSVGTAMALGDFRIEVLAPLRRYESPNDHSLVLAVSANGHRVLFSGDIETFAQSDLGPMRADVLKVPHQGALTSDLEWLRAVSSDVAVVPVGPNRYGHPAPEVLETLVDSGSEVLRTDHHGTIRIELGPGVIGVATERNP